MVYYAADDASTSEAESDDCGSFTEDGESSVISSRQGINESNIDFGPDISEQSEPSNLCATPDSSVAFAGAARTRTMPTKLSLQPLDASLDESIEETIQRDAAVRDPIYSEIVEIDYLPATTETDLRQAAETKPSHFPRAQAALEVVSVPEPTGVAMAKTDVVRSWFGPVTRCNHSEELCKSLVEEVSKQPCYYFQLDGDVFSKVPKYYFDYECGEPFLRKLLGDGLVRCQKSVTAVDDQTLSVGDESRQFIVEIGPKLRHQTPWCTNVLSALKSSGIPLVRIERTWVYLITVKGNASKSVAKKEIIERLHDPIMEEIYVKPITTFFDELKPLKPSWSVVPLIGNGREMLETVNKENAFGFDELDMKYYEELFVHKLKRNPSLVELCDLAQSNSEHSRHSFFKGNYILNGQMKPMSLMDMVIATNHEATTNQNNVIKFHDNSSAIVGYAVKSIVAKDPTKMSEFRVDTSQKHLLLTAETHNFPTGVAPFSGAATGAGGRIRDVMAAGRGGSVMAATAGYCVGQLHIDGYLMPWEIQQNYEGNFEYPLKIIIEASNGASDYGNKFGEPVIGGFFRSYGGTMGSERREWLKPIMFSAGIGMLEEIHCDKIDVNNDEFIKIGKIGGPAYRIGIGGGAASSVEVQGASDDRTANAVQRGDPQMGNKLNRFVRACIEMKNENPILSIHDQGAGGNANVLKEIVGGRGADIYASDFTLGDKSLTLQELWCAEYQESNAILFKDRDLGFLRKISKRENCNIDRVGELRSDAQFCFHHAKELSTNPLPVQFDLEKLKNMPTKHYNWVEKRELPEALAITEASPQEAIREALDRVLKLPSVASKRFLVTKVDRSVTGLVAQQQCVGPMQLPLADVSVTACSFFAEVGIATTIGEQPIMTMVNPAAGARMSLMEALASMVMAPISCLKDVKCSVNWMWPAKLEGEGLLMYDACEALCEHMKLLGVAVDGGKDSLSMAAMTLCPNNTPDKLVKAPGTVVVSAYAGCPDITRIVTPDLKGPRLRKQSSLLWVRPVAECRARLGGSALAQVYKSLGEETPDVTADDAKIFVETFSQLQLLIKGKDHQTDTSNKILACHDVSEGGLITCLVEMALAGCCGAKIKLPNFPKQDSLFNDGNDKAPVELATLFSEEVGWLLEVEVQHVPAVMERLKVAKCLDIGAPSMPEETSKVIVIGADDEEWLSASLTDLRRSWEETSYRLDLFQTTRSCATEEYAAFETEVKHSDYVCNFEYNKNLSEEKMMRKREEMLRKGQEMPMGRAIWQPRVAVLREEGTNGDREMAAAFMMSGFLVYDVTMTDLSDSQIDLTNYNGIAFPGGFSYADSLGAAIGWAASIKGNEYARRMLQEWHNKSKTFSIGVCNGCQLTSILGWQNISGGYCYDYTDSPDHRFLENLSGRFESRWSKVKIGKTDNIFMKGMEGAVLGVWVAHKEGRFELSSGNTLERYTAEERVALWYVDEENEPTEKYPMNPNGSKGGVAGVSSKCGRHLSLMPHPERCVLPWQWPYQGSHPSNLMRFDAGDDGAPSAAPWAKLFQNAFDFCVTPATDEDDY